jgi:hypothetical protein
VQAIYQIKSSIRLSISKLSDYKFIAVKTKLLLVAAMMTTLAGCASTPSDEGFLMTTPRARMSMEDLGMYKLDCNRAEEQFEFLNWHIPTKKERIANGFMMTSLFGWYKTANDGTWTDNWALKNGNYENTARILIAQLKERCQPGMPDAVKTQPQGCLHLDESMTAGASTGSQCIQNTGKGTQQKTSRWEAIVVN